MAGLVLALVLCAAMLCSIFSLETAKAAVSEKYRDKDTKLAYTLKNIPHGGAAIQNIYVTENYVYTTQRFDVSGGNNRNDVAFGRFAINKAQKTATYKDEMILLDCGHGEILDRYSYRNTYYFLVGAKAQEENDNIWSIQVARLKYEPGVKKKYTQLCRLAGLACANSSGKSKLEAVRVAAAASGDDTQLAIRTELATKDGKKHYLQYSIYKLKEVNALLDKVEKKTENYLSFKGNAALKKLCSYSYCPAKGQAVQPNGSFQGMEISGSAIYISGGCAAGAINCIS